MPNAIGRLRLACAVLVMAFMPLAAAAEDSGDSHPLKLTAGSYHYSDDTNGIDLNVRHSSDFGNAWLGYYRDDNVSQWRTGWDRQFGETVRVQPSLQLASGGFVGGSVQAEVGAPWFAAAGLGRTNLRPYVNLNFDPNDSYVLALGRRDEARVVMLELVHDNRENPDQRHVHLYYRESLRGGNRVTIDVLHKAGTVEGEFIRRWGCTLTYDWPRFFARLAYDPKTNFTPVDAWRFSVGTRF